MFKSVNGNYLGDKKSKNVSIEAGSRAKHIKLVKKRYSSHDGSQVEDVVTEYKRSDLDVELAQLERQKAVLTEDLASIDKQIDSLKALISDSEAFVA